MALIGYARVSTDEQDLALQLDYLGKGGAGFKPLSDGIDTTMASGKRVFPIMGALAEFERR